MQRRITAFLLALFLSSPVLGQSGWTRFAPPAGNFSILVPSTPETLPIEKETLNGKPVEIHLFRIKTSSLIYIVGWTEYNQQMDVEGELDADRDNFVKTLKGTLLGETTISLNNVPGREFIGENAQAFFISRVYVSGSRAYQAAVLLPTGTDDTRAVTRFLYSFQLTGAR